MTERTIGMTTNDRYTKPFPSGKIVRENSVWTPVTETPSDKVDKSKTVYVTEHDLVNNIVNFKNTQKPSHNNSLHAGIFLSLYRVLNDHVSFNPETGLLEVDPQE